MDEISRGLRQLWENRPWAVVLVILGFVVFVFVVIDTWYLRRRRRRHRDPKHWRP